MTDDRDPRRPSGAAPRPGRAAPDIRDAGAGDLACIAALERQLFDSAWSAAQLATEIGGERRLCLVAAAPGGRLPFGYLLARWAADEGEILRLGVAAGRRRRGVGSLLLETALHRLAAREVTRCHLEVRADDHLALRFYEGRDFRRVGRRAGYYSDRTPAVLLARDLAMG